MGQTVPVDVPDPLDDLPVLPRHAAEVLRLIDTPGISVRRVAAAIESDPILAPRILRLANAAWYGWSSRVSTLTEAVALVGVAGVRGHVIGAVAYELLRHGASGYTMERGHLWQHSTAVAAIARQLARRSGIVDAEAAFSAGLVHDIGKVVLSSRLGPRSHEVMARVNDGLDFVDAERIVLGCDHAEAGAAAARHWNLPAGIVQGIEFHHRPLEVERSGMTDVLYLAEVLALTLGLGLTSDGTSRTWSNGVLARIGLTPADVIDLLDAMMRTLAGMTDPMEDRPAQGEATADGSMRAARASTPRTGQGA